MDGKRFDNLARRWHRATTRRAAVLSGAGIALAGLVADRPGVAACKRQGATCKTARECCTNVCIKLNKKDKKKKCWCKQLGQACNRDANCCSLPAMLCEADMINDPICCLPLSSTTPCRGDNDCCGTSICADGRCIA